MVKLGVQWPYIQKTWFKIVNSSVDFSTSQLGDFSSKKNQRKGKRVRDKRSLIDLSILYYWYTMHIKQRTIWGFPSVYI